MVTTSERLEQRGWEVVDPSWLDEDQPPLELTSGAQLQALTDGFRLRLLGSIGRDPASAKELAARFDVPTTRLYHHLAQLEEGGFIRVVATRRSGARTERCYGQTSGAIRPSAELVAAEGGREFGAALRAMAEVVGVNLEVAVRSGALRTSPEGTGGDVVAWSTVRLTSEQQAGFARELEDLSRRIVEASQENLDADATDLRSVLAYVVLAPDVVGGESARDA